MWQNWPNTIRITDESINRDLNSYRLNCSPIKLTKTISKIKATILHSKFVSRKFGILPLNLVWTWRSVDKMWTERRYKTQKKTQPGRIAPDINIWFFFNYFVVGAGFEPATFRLWTQSIQRDFSSSIFSLIRVYINARIVGLNEIEWGLYIIENRFRS